MPGFDPTNLLWERRYRGSLATRSHCVADDGTVLILTPDELAARTYQILSISSEGTASEINTLTVETLHNFEVTPDGSFVIARTADDLYLFSQGRKSRFLGERRVAYADVDLARKGDVFVCAFSDMLGTSHTLTLGNKQGQALWSIDQSADILAVGIAADGGVVFCGSADGQVVALDRLRKEIWRRHLTDPVISLAAPPTGSRCVAGTETGGVALLGEDGELEWRVELGAPIVAISADDELRWTLAVAGDRVSGILSCLGGTGEVLWQKDLERGPTGVAFSPAGNHFCVSLIGGYLETYAAEFADLEAESRQAGLEVDVAKGQELLAAGNPAAAREIFHRLLAGHATRTDIAAALLEATQALVLMRREEAASHAAMGLFAEAAATLDDARALLPYDEELFSDCVRARGRALEALRNRADSRLADGDPASAAGALRELLGLAPLDVDARESLVEAQGAQAKQLLASGDEREQAGDFDGAVEAWAEAVRLHPSSETEERHRQGLLAHCMREALALYEENRLSEAAFQFRKVLSIDPSHAEAQRYLGYSQEGGQRTLIEDRFSRLE